MLLPAAAIAAAPTLTTVNGVAVIEGHGAPAKQTHPYWRPAAGRITVFNNLGTPVSYDSTRANAVVNLAGSPYAVQQWVAFPIKPTKSVTLTEIVEGLSHVQSGKLATIALLADSNGVPGKVLTEKTFNVTNEFGGCCKLVVYKVTDGTKLLAGKTYWVGTILPSKSETTTYVGWDYAVPITGGTIAVTSSTQGGWRVSPNQPVSDFAVFGE